MDKSRITSIVVAQSSSVCRGITLLIITMVCNQRLSDLYQNYEDYVHLSNYNVLLGLFSGFDVASALVSGLLFAKHTCKGSHGSFLLCVVCSFLALLFAVGEFGFTAILYTKLTELHNERDTLVNTQTTYFCGTVFACILTVLQLVFHIRLCTCPTPHFNINLRALTDHVDSKRLMDTDATSTNSLVYPNETLQTKTFNYWWQESYKPPVTHV